MQVSKTVPQLNPKSERNIVLFLHGILALLCLYHLVLCVQQYRAFQFFIADVGQFDIMLYNSLKGKFFFSPVHDTNHLTKHFTPLLILLLPLRAVFNHILFLPLLEVMAIFSGAWGVAKLWSGILYRNKIKKGFTPLGLILGILFVSNPLIGSILLANHIESFAVGFGIWALVAWAYNWRKRFWVFLVLTIITKEDIALYWLIFGLWLMIFDSPLKHKNGRFFGIQIFAASFLYLIFAIIMMNLLTQYYNQPASEYLPRYAYLGNTVGEKIWQILTTWQLLFWPLYNQLWILLPTVLFLPLIRPSTVLLLFPGCYIMGLASLDSMHQLFYYYSYPFIPFLYLAALLGLQQILLTKKIQKRRIQAFKIVSILLLVICTYQFTAITRVDGKRRSLPKVMARHNWIRQNLNKHVPADASVVAQFDLFCQIQARKEMWPLALKNLNKGEFWIIDLKGFYGDVNSQTMREMLDLVKNLKKNDDLKEHFNKDGLMILQINDRNSLKPLDVNK